MKGQSESEFCCRAFSDIVLSDILSWETVMKYLFIEQIFFLEFCIQNYLNIRIKN